MEEKFCGVWGQMREEFLKNDPLEWILQSEKIQEDVRAALAEEICR